MNIKLPHTKLVLSAALCFALLYLCAGAPLLLAATQQESLHKAIQDFEALTRDAKKGMWRDSWEKLEARFAAVERQGADFAAEAFFYQARSREELADRSRRKADWQSAARLYSDFVTRYRQHPLADNAAYNRAVILAGHLNAKDEAVRLLESLIADYPDGDAFSDAIILRERLLPGSPPPPAGQTPPKPARADADRQQELYTAAASEWRSLLVDAKRGALRENWLNLEKSFGAALSAAPGGSEAHKAAFQVARSREELAARSGLKADWQEAARLFGDMAANYPESSLADDSLYARADILARRLNDPAAARADLNEILSRYSGGDMSAKAKKLLAGLPAGAAGSAPAASSRAPAPARQKPAPSGGNIVEQLGLGIQTIMIDAGHGGKDPGALGSGVREAAITLNLAKKLGAELKKKGFTVLYTREANRFVPLEDRTSLANSKKADIFVSIHVNASTNKKLHGLETYYLDVARSDAARVVAARENAVNVGQANDLQFILSDLTRNNKREESLALSRQVQKACISRIGKAGFKMRDNGVRSAPFHVLMGARMPAFLIEVGYLSHSGDAGRIKNDKYIQAVASGIADGVLAYQKQLGRLSR